MDIIPGNRRTNSNGLAKAARAVFAVAKQASDAGLFKEAHKMYKSVSQQRSQQRRARNAAKPQAKQQSVNQRSVKMAAPTSFGISSNNVIRAVVQRNTATMSRLTGVSYLGPVMSPNLVNPLLPQLATFSSSNPITFQDRLQIHASTYDKYVYNSVKLKYVPAVGTDLAGKVAIAIDRDYTDPPQTSSWGETISYESIASGTVWSEHSCSMKRDPSEKRSYFTNITSGVEIRDTEQFKFYAYVQGVSANTFCGDLYLEYDIDLISPVYAPSELANVLSSAGTFYNTTTVVNATVGTSWTISGLPIDDGTRSIYEIVFSSAPNTTGITISNSTGAAYAPSVSGSFRLYARGSGSVSGTRTYALFLDYNSAFQGSPALYQNAALGSALFNYVTIAYRRLTYTSVTA